MSGTLSEFLVPEAVCLNLEAADCFGVISAVGDKLLQAGYVHPTFTEAALAREKNIPTGLPLNGQFNAAIPHTDIEHVIKPGVGLATLRTPVVFMNMVSPEEPVEAQLVFVLALEQPKSQIEMLQQIAGVLQNPSVVEGLMQARDLADVYAALK
jgi:galactitol PTS system EIIA component